MMIGRIQERLAECMDSAGRARRMTLGAGCGGAPSDRRWAP